MKNLKGKLKQHFIKGYVNQHLDAYTGYLEDWDINQAIKEAEAKLDELTASKPWKYAEIRKVLVKGPASDKAIRETFNVGIDWGFGQIDSHNDVIMPGAFKKFNDRKPPFDISKYSTPVRSLIDMKFTPSTEEELKQKIKEWREHPLQHSVRMAYSEKKLKSSIPEREPVLFGTSNDGINWVDSFKTKIYNGSDFPNDENNRRWMPLVENSHYADSIAYALSVYKLPADIFEKLSVIEWFEAQGTSKHLSIAKRLREIIGNPYQVHDEIIIEA